MKKIQLFIFDWDGTLADSAGQIVSEMQRAIVELNLPPRDDRTIRELIGLGWQDVLGRLFPELDPMTVLRQLMDYRRRMPPTRAHEAPLFEGVLDSLSELHRGGKRLAIATGKPRVGLDASFVAHPGLHALISLSRCADETASKPDPLMLRQILEVTGLSPDEALMIGDTEFDVAMARAIGMPALGVGCGVHEHDRLLDAGAAAVIDSVKEMPAWLRSRGAEF